VDEVYSGVTNSNGVATTSVAPTRQVGAATFSASWDGLRGVTASATGNVQIADATDMALDAGNPASGQVTDSVTVGATLTDSDGTGLAGKTVVFTIGTASASGTTDASGYASAVVTLAGPAGSFSLQAGFAGEGAYGPSSASSTFSVLKEVTILALTDAVATKNQPAVATATLTEADGAPLGGMEIVFYVKVKSKNIYSWKEFARSTTNANGVATANVPTKYVSTQKVQIQAVFAESDSFLSSTGNAFTYKK